MTPEISRIALWIVGGEGRARSVTAGQRQDLSPPHQDATLLCQVTGELPITLTGPDRSLIQRQKTPVSTFGLNFYRPMLERFYRQGGGSLPPVYSIFIFTNDGAGF
jgi:hypothetical protein